MSSQIINKAKFYPIQKDTPTFRPIVSVVVVWLGIMFSASINRYEIIKQREGKTFLW